MFRSFRQIARHHSRGQNRFRICLRTLIAKTTSLCYSELPNILGYSNIAGYYDLATTSGGALSDCSRWTFSIVREPGTAGGIININAARSNSIYGGSRTDAPEIEQRTTI